MPVIYKGISMTGLSRTEADNLYAKKEDLDNLETSSKDLSSGTTFIVDLGSSDPPQQDAEISVYADEFVGFKPEVSDDIHSAILRCNGALYFATFKVTAVGPESATIKFVEAPTPATNLENYYDKAAIDELLSNLETGDIDLSDYVTKEELNEVDTRLTEEINKRLEATVQTTDFDDLIKIVGAAEGSPLEPTSKIEFIQEGTGTPSLTNIRNIIGWDSIELRHSGKNLLNTTEFHTQANWTSSTTITGGYDYNITLPKGTYTISFPSDVDASQYLYVFVGGAQTNMIQAGLKMSSYTFTITEDTTIRIFELGYSLTSIPDNSPLSKLQIEEGIVATAFEPYFYNKLKQDLPDLVYYGTFDWSKGLLTVTHKFFQFRVGDMNGSDNNFPGWINVEGLEECFPMETNRKLNAGEFVASSTTGVGVTLYSSNNFKKVSIYDGLQSDLKEQYPDVICQFLFPLLEPKTIQLTKHTIPAIKGTNILSSNCGQTSVSYQLDLKEYIDNKTPDVDLSNYYTKDETYSKEEVDTKFDELELPEGGSGDVFPVKSPVGTIVIWSGTEENIPTGWQLCDGTNDTPDLRDKFVLGAGPEHAVGDSGGEEEVTLTTDQLPSHNHAERISTTQSPYNQSMIGPTNGSTYGYRVSDSAIETNALGIGQRTNTVGEDQPHNNMPPYYALCFIMKVRPDETDGGTQFTTDDTLTMTDDNILGVTTPVNTILTQAEYDALPEDQRNKGLYVVEESGDNVSSGGGSGYLNIYSTEEVVIGEWFGKPLYRVCGTYVTSSNLATSSKSASISLSSIFPNNDFSNIFLIKSRFFCRNKIGQYISSDATANAMNSDLGHVIPDQSITLHRATDTAIRNKTASVVLYNSSSNGMFVNCTIHAILEYTKTTD